MWINGGEKMRLKNFICIILLICFQIGGVSVVKASDPGGADIEYSTIILEEGFIEEVAGESDIVTYSNRNTINWKVKTGVLKRSAGFQKKAGEKIRINIKLSPNKKVWVGIIRENGQKIYSQTTTGLSKTFNVEKAGKYSVFVQNRSSKTIQAVGYYER